MAMVINEWNAVHEAAELLGVSADTIRRWEKKGLIRAKRGKHGERLFEQQELRRVAEQGENSSGVWTQLKAEKSSVSLIELFCGAGGLALGLSNAGLESKLLVDSDSNAIKTLQQNRPDWNSRVASVTEINLHEFEGKVSVMVGGFPCQAFSYAGKQRGFEDARGTLFYDFARLVSQVKPKMVVAENVKGLFSHDGGKTLETILNILYEMGYESSYKLMRSQFLDVPQKRERLIIMATRKELKLKHLFPEEKRYTVSLKTAIAGAPSSDGQEYSAAKKAIMRLIPPGGYWKDLPLDIQKQYMGGSFLLGGGKTGMARRLSWEEPSLTLTCNPAQKQTERCHPAETRPLTVREYARIQCFPDDWEFFGSTSSKYKQIGNAVPVNLGYHVGLAVRAVLGEISANAEKPAELVSGTKWIPTIQSGA
jgi:DNA (cytosine-5)-methyltransferase 1